MSPDVKSICFAIIFEVRQMHSDIASEPLMGPNHKKGPPLISNHTGLLTFAVTMKFYRRYVIKRNKGERNAVWSSSHQKLDLSPTPLPPFLVFSPDILSLTHLERSLHSQKFY